jgi:hypothetical protein
MENFNLNYIIKRLIKNNKINNYYQKGGEESVNILKKEIEDFAVSANKLILYKNLLEQKLKSVNRLDVEPITRMLSKLENDLKAMKDKITTDIDPEISKDLILNQIQTIDRFILNSEDDAININLERTPKLISAPINSDELTVGLDTSVEMLIKNTDEFKKMINDKTTITNKQYEEKKKLLITSLESLRRNHQVLKNNITIIETEYRKLEDYKKIGELEILPNNFKISEPSDIDSIDMEQLSGITPLPISDPSLIQNLKVEDIYEEEIRKKINDVNSIINPNIVRLQSGGNNIVNQQIQNTQQIIVDIYNNIRNKILAQEKIRREREEREIQLREERERRQRKERERQERERQLIEQRERIIKINKEIDEINQKLDLISRYKDLSLDLDIIKNKISISESSVRKINAELNQLKRGLSTKTGTAKSNIEKNIKEKEQQIKKLEKEINNNKILLRDAPNIIRLIRDEGNIKQRLDELLLVKQQIEKGLQNKYILKGGNWDDYNQTISSMYQLINEIKMDINQFKKIAMKFNLRYIQFYYHQYFVINYINLIFFRKNYIITRFISRGLVSFYLSICEDIYKKMNNNKILKENKIISYFFKYHYMTISIIKSFLEKLYSSWDTILNPSLGERNRPKINSYKFIMKNPVIKYNTNLSKGILLFDIFKNILDNYYTYQAPPVAVYLRINDFGNIQRKTFKKSTENRTKFDQNAFDVCTLPPTGETQLKLTSYKQNISDVEFKEIYDPEGFNDNAVLSNYMGIPSFLTDNRSIMMITYGYSGVGKTFTLFGGGDNKGVLQNSIIGIQGTEKILCRCFEIYGKALPYKSYWLNKSPNDYNHKLHIYNLSNFNNIVEDPEISTNFNEYLNKTKGINEDTYYQLNPEQVSVFEKVVSGIDKIRIEKGRIKKTVNNPVSSRSIMMYEFKLILKGNKVSRFIVMDLPGKEDVISSYVDNDTEGYCIKVKPEFEIYGRALRAALFVNPMMIALFPSVSNYILTNYSYYLNRDTLSRNPPKLSKVKINEFKLKEGSVDANLKVPLENIIKTVEIIKILIDENKIDELEKIYNNILINENIKIDNKDVNCNNTFGSSLPFEAFYINENITGLIKVLAERLYQGDDKKQKRDELLKKFEYMDNFYSKIMKDETSYNQIDRTSVSNFTLFSELSEPVKTQVESILPKFSEQVETRSQVYFLRSLIRTPEINYNNRNFSMYWFRTNINTLLNKDYSDYYINGKFTINKNTKTLQQWFENTYDFNKIYSEEPPIKTFLQAYFGVEDILEGQSVAKNIIDNFYLFFVVSNKNHEKCGNQIKLINDSKIFIDVLSQF